MCSSDLAGEMMQSYVWIGLVIAAGACVVGVALIVRSAMTQMKARRRKEKVTRWVRSEIGLANEGARPRRTDRIFSS